MADDPWAAFADAPQQTAPAPSAGGAADPWAAFADAPKQAAAASVPPTVSKEAVGLFKRVEATADAPEHYEGPRGEWVMPDQLGNAAKEREQLVHEKANASELPGVGVVRSALTGATFGWEPKIMGALPGGEAAAETAMSERERQEKFRSEHPYANFALGTAGGAASLMGAGQVAAATPYVGPALAGAGNALGAIRNSVGWVPAAAATGAVIGAPLGAIEAAGEDKPIGQGAVSGAVGGALLTPGLEGAGRAISRAVAPWVSRHMAGEIADGARPTFGEAVASEDPHLPGQGGNVLGRLFKSKEDVEAGYPIAGAPIRQAQQTSREIYNLDRINSALEPIGESIAPDTPVGRPMIREMGDRLGAAYNQLIPQISGEVDAPLTHSIQQAETRVPVALRQDFNNEIDRIVISKSHPQTGELSGQNFKDAEAELRQAAVENMSSPNPSDRRMGRAFADVRDELFQMMDRHNTPDVADRLRAINHGYSMLIPIEKAAGTVGAKDGVFNASALFSALKATDQTARKRGFSRGTAQLQEDIENAKNAMVRTISDSGTPGRLETTLMGTVAAIPRTAFSALTYNPVAQNVLRTAAAGAYGPRRAFSNEVAANAPGVATVLGQQQNVQDNAPFLNYLAGR